MSNTNSNRAAKDAAAFAASAAAFAASAAVEKAARAAAAKAALHVYRAYDPLTEWMSRVVAAPELAEELADCHNDGCASAGGVGSAIVVKRSKAGWCETLAGEAVWPPHGRTSGAVRFDT